STGAVEPVLERSAAALDAALQPERLELFVADEENGPIRQVLPPGGLTPLPAEVTGTVPTPDGGLLVSLFGREVPVGVLALGPRRGDLPYSRDDRALVEAVAWQMALAVEAHRLVKRLAEDERMRQEVAMASEVQRRLFPESPPACPGLELAGLC